MCGFYGTYNRVVKTDQQCVRARGMLLAHRGPDGGGEWVSRDGSAGLAHRRLSVIDLSENGRQPMLDHAGNNVLVFNGELYNYKDLRRELEQTRWNFSGNSDSEVLLAAYAVWGESCLSRFQGMFAFAVIENDHQGMPKSVFLGRDRVGKKPLYYCQEPGRIEFASELKALSGSRGLDLSALNYYLARGYVPDDMCMAADVRKLPAAHAARYDIATGMFRVWRYWDIPPQDCIAQSIDDLKAEAGGLLSQAVETRLNADVPVGIFLSGGFDSALMTAYAAKISKTPIHTFTAKMQGSRLDESEQARRIARHFGTDHHELSLDAISLKSIEDLMPFVDEPVGDSSILPFFLISRLAREHIVVALSGDGGDEVFGGYTDYPTSLSEQERFGWVSASAVSRISSLAGRLPAGVRGRGKLVSWKRGVTRQMAWGTPYFDPQLRRRILSNDAFPFIGQLDAPEMWIESLMVGRDLVDQMTRAHFKSILADDFLVKVDRASMANGLEVRCPYLDSRLVEFAFGRLPSEQKVNAGVTRRLQRRLAADMLPRGLDFSRKQGFSIPFDDWLRSDSCKWLRRRLETLPAIIRRSTVEELIRGELAGRANGARLFNLLMLAAASENMGWA